MSLILRVFCLLQLILACLEASTQSRLKNAQKLIERAGPNTKIMRKAKMSFQSGQVKQVIRTYAVEIQTSDKRELEADAVTMKLRKAMGANCEMTLYMS